MLPLAIIDITFSLEDYLNVRNIVFTTNRMMSNYLGFVLLIKLNYKLTEPLSVYPIDVKFRISIAHISGDITYNILSLFPPNPP